MQMNDAIRDHIKAMREEDPSYTQAEMGRALGVSKQRIRQLLIDLGLPLVYRPPRETK